jgi:thiamine transporter
MLCYYQPDKYYPLGGQHGVLLRGALSATLGTCELTLAKGSGPFIRLLLPTCRDVRGFSLLSGEMERKAMLQTFLGGFTNPFSGPITLTTILIAGGLMLLTALFFILRKMKLDTRTLVIASMCVTIAFILSYIRFFTMPQGGSITPGSMLPILLFAWVFGPIPGIAVGVVYGLLQFMQDGFVITYGVMQPFFDYVFAFGVLGLAGVFKRHLNIGIVVAVSLRYAFHVISGVLFFSMFAKDQPVWIYSSLYNGFMLPELLICLAIANIPQFKSAVKRIFQGKPVTL